MTPLEQKLVGSIVQNYKANGINVQRLLDNPEFVALPLQSKVAAIEHYASDLTQTQVPTNPLNAVRSAATSAILTGGTVLLSRAISKYMFGQEHLGEAFGAPVLAAAALGGSLGLLKSVVNDLSQYKTDKATANYIATEGAIPVLARNSSVNQGVQSKIMSKLMGGNPMIQEWSNRSNIYHAQAHHTNSIFDLLKQQG